jgi:uncharacterized membrane protein
MISKWRWLVLQFTRRLWVRASLLALIGVVSALGSIYLERYLPEELPAKIGANAVDGILEILASSMLAVTTFSLSVMVAAYASATSNVTPRATKLLMQDSTTQNVLATFIGSFLFSLVGLIALSMGAYGSRGRVVLFVVTIAMIILIVITILRWIDHLNRLGRVGETTDKVEKSTAKALRERLESPAMGGQLWTEAIPDSASPILSSCVGYVQHVDLGAINRIAEDCNCDIYVTAIAGKFVHPARPLVWLERQIEEKSIEKIRSAFTIDDERNFDQDPRFGLVVLAEIGSRALSPAVNDPGTAIDVIGRGVRLLHLWTSKNRTSEPEICFPRLRIMPLDLDEMFHDVFSTIARDGAALIEVQLRLQKGLLALAELGDADSKQASYRISRIALKRAEKAIEMEEEKIELRQIASKIEALVGSNSNS